MFDNDKTVFVNYILRRRTLTKNLPILARVKSASGSNRDFQSLE